MALVIFVYLSPPIERGSNYTLNLTAKTGMSMNTVVD